MSELLRLIEAYGGACVVDHVDGYHRPGKAHDDRERCKWELVEYVDRMTLFAIEGRTPTAAPAEATGEGTRIGGQPAEEE